MKYIEVTKKEAQDIVRSGCLVNVGIYQGVNPKWLKDIQINPDDYNILEYFTIEEFITKIISELDDNCHYTFKFFEVWN